MPHLLVRIAMLAALTGGSAAASAQSRDALEKLSGFWAAKFDREPYGQVLVDKLPKGTHVLVDTALVPELPIGDFGGLTVTQRAKDEVSRFNPAAQRGPS